MTEIPIRTVNGPDKKSKPEEKPRFIVNGKEIKTHAELGREEYLKELLSPKLKWVGFDLSYHMSLLSGIAK